MIAVVYIGQNRFKNSTKLNHQLFFNRLKNLSEFKIYDFSDSVRHNCPYNPEILEQRGNLQLWDFATSLDKISEDIIIKIRTDLWFTLSSIDTILSETKKIIDSFHDVSFLGHNFKRTYAEKYLVEENITKNSNVRDLVIIFKKSKIYTSQEILKRNKNFGNVRSGNKIHGQILKDNTMAVNVYCQLYLVREDFLETVDPWYVCYQFIKSWNQKKARDAMQWILSMKNYYDNI